MWGQGDFSGRVFWSWWEPKLAGWWMDRMSPLLLSLLLFLLHKLGRWAGSPFLRTQGITQRWIPDTVGQTDFKSKPGVSMHIECKCWFFLLIFIELYIFLCSTPYLPPPFQPSPRVPMLPIYSGDLIFLYYPYRLDLCMSLLGSSLLSRFSGIVICGLVFFALCLKTNYEWVHVIIVFLSRNKRDIPKHNKDNIQQTNSQHQTKWRGISQWSHWNQEQDKVVHALIIYSIWFLRS